MGEQPSVLFQEAEILVYSCCLYTFTILKRESQIVPRFEAEVLS